MDALEKSKCISFRLTNNVEHLSVNLKKLCIQLKCLKCWKLGRKLKDCSPLFVEEDLVQCWNEKDQQSCEDLPLSYEELGDDLQYDYIFQDRDYSQD